MKTYRDFAVGQEVSRGMKDITGVRWIVVRIFCFVVELDHSKPVDECLFFDLQEGADTETFHDIHA